MWAREWGEVQPKANLNIPQLETAQCSTRRWISRQSLATGYSYFPSLSLPGFIFSSLLFRPFSPSSQTGRHMSNEKGGEKYSSQISQGDREGRRGREIGGNKSTALSFHRLFLTFSHTLLHHELILHSLLVISFSSYRLNMSRRQTSTRLFCPPPSPQALSYTLTLRLPTRGKVPWMNPLTSRQSQTAARSYMLTSHQLTKPWNSMALIPRVKPCPHMLL